MCGTRGQRRVRAFAARWRPYGDDVAEPDLGRLRDAYAAAWATRQETRDASAAVLLDTLVASGLEVFSSPGPGRDLMLSLWEGDVPPEALEDELRREARRALPGIAGAALSSLSKSAVEIVRLFRGGSWERVDVSWQELPDGYRRLSDARQANDLVLRWLHSPVEEVALEFRADEAAAAAIERCRQAPSANRHGWGEARCWLLPDDGFSAQVIVGTERIGWTTVPDHAWAAIKREEQRHIFADGSVFLDHSGAQIELVCFLPRQR